MAHEIMEHDGLILTGQAAWHGLGTIVENAPTPKEALKIAGLDWGVEKYTLAAKSPTRQHEVPVTKWVGVYRTDVDVQLGMVGKGYTPIQNAQLADFCTMLAEGSDVVKVETAGSIRNGAKVWFLLRGNSFSVRGSHDNDVIHPYFLIANGHDGFTGATGTATSTRVVCSNTLHLVIPDNSRRGSTAVGKLQTANFRFNHTGNIMKRLDEAKAALKLYNRSVETTREVIDALAAKTVTSTTVQEFFLSCYVRDFGAVPTNPTNKKDANAKERAMDAWLAVEDRFDRESEVVGANLWCVMNAYTGWLQNDRQPRSRNVAKAKEQKLNSRLFGDDANRTQAALATAIGMAG